MYTVCITIYVLMFNHKDLETHLLSQHNLDHSDSFLSPALRAKLRLLQCTGRTWVFRHLLHRPSVSLPCCFSSCTELTTGLGVYHTLPRLEASMHVQPWGSTFPPPQMLFSSLWTYFVHFPFRSSLKYHILRKHSLTLTNFVRTPTIPFIASCFSFTALCNLEASQCATF